MTNEELLTHAKTMRSEMTPAEARLWYHLRAKRLGGVKFTRQVPRKPYVADFVARSRKLVIEVDGDTHAGSETYDSRRTARLERLGYTVLRFTNADVMGNEEGVLATILDVVRTPPLPDPLPKGEREQGSPLASFILPRADHP